MPLNRFLTRVAGTRAVKRRIQYRRPRPGHVISSNRSPHGPRHRLEKRSDCQHKLNATVIAAEVTFLVAGHLVGKLQTESGSLTLVRMKCISRSRLSSTTNIRYYDLHQCVSPASVFAYTHCGGCPASERSGGFQIVLLLLATVFIIARGYIVDTSPEGNPDDDTFHMDDLLTITSRKSFRRTNRLFDGMPMSCTYILTSHFPIFCSLFRVTGSHEVPEPRGVRRLQSGVLLLGFRQRGHLPGLYPFRRLELPSCGQDTGSEMTMLEMSGVG